MDDSKVMSSDTSENDDLSGSQWSEDPRYSSKDYTRPEIRSPSERRRQNEPIVEQNRTLENLDKLDYHHFDYEQLEEIESISKDQGSSEIQVRSPFI